MLVPRAFDTVANAWLFHGPKSIPPPGKGVRGSLQKEPYYFLAIVQFPEPASVVPEPLAAEGVGFALMRVVKERMVLTQFARED